MNNPRRNELASIPFLNNAFDLILAQWNRLFSEEHDADGHHTHITAQSILVEGSPDGLPPRITEDSVIADILQGREVIVGTAAPGPGAPRVTLHAEAGPTLFVDGHVLPDTNALYDLGAFSAERWRGLFLSDAIFERARTIALGVGQAVPFTAADFTASTGTWTVDAGDVTQFRATLVGMTMVVSFLLIQTDVSATPTDLRIKIPFGFTAAAHARAQLSTIDAGGAPQFGMVLTVPGDTMLHCYRDASGGGLPWSTTAADNTGVAGNITIEVA